MMRRLANGIFYFASHPTRIPGRIGAVRIGNRTLNEICQPIVRAGHMMRRLANGVLYFATHPTRIPRRIAAVRIGNSTLNQIYRHHFPGLAREIDIFRRYRANLLEPATGPLPSLSEALLGNAKTIHGEDKFSILSAISTLERGFAADPSRTNAVELSTLQRLANRHKGALQTLRVAHQANPTDRELWYEVIIYAMRHGVSAADTNGLLDGILAKDPTYPLARFFKNMYQEYPNYVTKLYVSVEAARESKKPALFIGFAVWGKRYVFLLERFTLASLLAENNLPRVAATHDIHIAIFTTEADANALRESGLYPRLCQFATFHFVIFSDAMLEVSKHSLHRIAVHASFGLMSSAHYAILECARRMKASAIILGSDNVVNDSCLSSLVSAAEDGASAIVVPGFRLPAQHSLELVNQLYRADDGTISISGQNFGRLLSECLPEECFVDAESFSQFPLFLCWRVGSEGILAHANHLHPILINGDTLRQLSNPGIDPIDGRLLVRYSKALDKIQIVDDCSVCLFDAAENPLVSSPAAARKFDAFETGMWLWQFDDGLRARYLRTPIRYQFGENRSAAWNAVEKLASQTVNEVLGRMNELQSKNGRSDDTQ